ncbi:MAG: hypothetical protein Q8L24_00920 [bacterium]|nr:hypothetical protein [bacterium]
MMNAGPTGLVSFFREEVKRLEAQIKGSISKELAHSVLIGAEAELAKAESGIRAVADEIKKSRGTIKTLLAKLNSPT